MCGDGRVTGEDEECDLGPLNGLRLDRDLNPSAATDAVVYCTSDCTIPSGHPHSRLSPRGVDELVPHGFQVQGYADDGYASRDVDFVGVVVFVVGTHGG